MIILDKINDQLDIFEMRKIHENRMNELKWDLYVDGKKANKKPMSKKEMENMEDKFRSMGKKNVDSKIVSEANANVGGKQYDDFFKSMLKKYKIKSYKDLPKDKQKKFFDEVDKKWSAKKETD